MLRAKNIGQSRGVATVFDEKLNFCKLKKKLYDFFKFIESINIDLSKLLKT
jgi:hypothetical protein